MAKKSSWIRFKKESGMTREVISHFLFFTERILGLLKVMWAKTSYPKDPLLCETSVLAKLENKDCLPVNIFTSVGRAQPDCQELMVKGTKNSRKVAEFYKDSESMGDNFIHLREEPRDPGAVSLNHSLII